MWKEDPHKAAMMSDDMQFIDVEEIAQAMYDLVVNEELGDGTIYEVTAGKTRVVPLFNSPPPSGFGLGSSGFAASFGETYDRLRKDGMAV
jgi:hypothetical protein